MTRFFANSLAACDALFLALGSIGSIVSVPSIQDASTPVALVHAPLA